MRESTVPQLVIARCCYHPLPIGAWEVPLSETWEEKGYLEGPPTRNCDLWQRNIASPRGLGREGTLRRNTLTSSLG